jgi:hypothetical protein
MRTFDDTTQEELHFRKVQLNQYSHAYHVTAFCPVEQGAAPTRNIITRAILEAEEDADVHFTRISGSCIGPVDRNGQLVTAGVPAFLAAGVTAGRADRGVGIRITNYSTGVDLTGRYQDPQVGATQRNDFIPAGLLLTPGYGFTFYKPFPFDYVLSRTQKILFEFRNRDSENSDNFGHRISVCLIGQRIER